MNYLHHARVAATLILCTFSLFAAPIELGTRRELFVDHFLIDQLNGAELRLHLPVSAGVALRFDRPWEGISCAYVTVIKDGGIYHLYYRGRPSISQADATAEAREVACYARSEDGAHWTRPNLGLFEVDGTRENNVILTEPKNVTHNFCPFLDDRPGVPAAERFKAVGGTGSAGLFGYVSPDGIHWKPARAKPLLTEGAFDSQNVVFWSELEQAYLCYFRTWKKNVRWISRSTSPDFLNWTPPVDMTFGDTPPEHLYINQTRPYFRAPHLYLATPARFQPNRQALTEAQARALDLESPKNYKGLKEDISDAVFMSSRGGTAYDRTFLESFVRPGLDPRNWVSRANYPALGVVPTGPEEMSLYILRHNGQASLYLERMTLRTDGFTSLHAPFAAGEMVTKALRFSGRQLELNLATSAAGGARVELQDAEGKALPGYALADCAEIIGDQLDRVVTWKNGSDLGQLVGQTLRLRFRLKDADLFSFRFRP